MLRGVRLSGCLVGGSAEQFKVPNLLGFSAAARGYSGLGFRTHQRGGLGGGGGGEGFSARPLETLSMPSLQRPTT